jgi:voltage-gated potassium channel Kch
MDRLRNALIGIAALVVLTAAGTLGTCVSRMGRMVCRELAAKPVPFVVTERDESEARHAEEDGYAVLVGDATEEDVLREAGLARAAALISAVPPDAENVFTTLTARALRPDVIVVARAETGSGAERLRQAGVTRAVSAYAIGGHRMGASSSRSRGPIARAGSRPLGESEVRENLDVR